jgi:hypothetical protein
MSWSVSGEIQASDTTALMEMRDQAVAQNSTCGDQFDAAAKTALTLMKSNAIGGADKSFSVTLGGHANPDHEPVPGWANDFIVVSIVQKSIDENGRAPE